MSVDFDFFVDDLMTSLKMIKDAIKTIKNIKGVLVDYATFVIEINSLQNKLKIIDDFQLSCRGLSKQQLTIERAIGACRKCVDNFMMLIVKYQLYFQNQITSLTSNYRKIRWALCKKKNITLFQTRLERHTSFINMLILSLQAYGQASAGRGQGNSSDVLMSLNQSQDCAILNMLRNLSIEQRQCLEILMRQNQDLMRSVQNLQRMLQIQMTIFSQILFQQSMILLNAFDKLTFFYLKFIDCLEIFTAILKIRFRKKDVKQFSMPLFLRCFRFCNVLVFSILLFFR